MASRTLCLADQQQEAFISSQVARWDGPEEIYGSPIHMSTLILFYFLSSILADCHLLQLKDSLSFYHKAIGDLIAMALFKNRMLHGACLLLDFNPMPSQLIAVATVVVSPCFISGTLYIEKWLLLSCALCLTATCWRNPSKVAVRYQSTLTRGHMASTTSTTKPP